MVSLPEYWVELCYDPTARSETVTKLMIKVPEDPDQVPICFCYFIPELILKNLEKGKVGVSAENKEPPDGYDGPYTPPPDLEFFLLPSSADPSEYMEMLEALNF